MRAEAIARLGDMGGGFVAIGIGSSEMLRQWGGERFAGLAGALLDAGWPALVLMGGAEDLTAATAIVKSWATVAGGCGWRWGGSLRT